MATRKSPAATNSSGVSTPVSRKPPEALRGGSTASATPLYSPWMVCRSDMAAQTRSGGARCSESKLRRFSLS